MPMDPEPPDTRTPKGLCIWNCAVTCVPVECPANVTPAINGAHAVIATCDDPHWWHALEIHKYTQDPQDPELWYWARANQSHLWDPGPGTTEGITNGENGSLEWTPTTDPEEMGFAPGDVMKITYHIRCGSCPGRADPVLYVKVVAAT